MHILAIELQIEKLNFYILEVYVAIPLEWKVLQEYRQINPIKPIEGITSKFSLNPYYPINSCVINGLATTTTKWEEKEKNEKVEKWKKSSPGLNVYC